MGNDLYTVVHSKGYWGHKPPIVRIPAEEVEAKYQNGSFRDIINYVLKQPDTEFNEEQRNHINLLREYCKLDQRSEGGWLEIFYYDKDRNQQNKQGVKGENVITPHIIRDLKVDGKYKGLEKVDGKTYDRLEILVDYIFFC